MFWTFEKGIFEWFPDFWVLKLKPFSWKMSKSVQNFLNQNFISESFLENGFEVTLSSKANVLKTFFWESEAKRSKLFKSKIDYTKLHRNGFQTTLSSKTNAPGVWKKHFWVVSKHLSGEVQTVFWEREAKHSKLVKSKIDHRKLLWNWLWSYLRLINEYSRPLKRTVISKLLSYELETVFWTVKQSVEKYLNQKLIIGSLLESDSQAIWSSKMNVLRVWKVYFSVFCKFLNDEVKTVIWEGGAKHLKLSKSNFGDKNFLQNGFEVALSLKTNFLSLSKSLFWVFCKFLSDEVKTVFWESETMRPKVFKSKVDHRKSLKKWFSNYLELKNECSESLKSVFFSFLQVFEWRN